MTQSEATLEQATAKDISEEEARALLESSPDQEGDNDQSTASRMESALDTSDTTAIPDWCPLPERFVVPPGKRVAAMRFRGAWTDAPSKGDRVVLCWSLSEVEERLAYNRSKGDGAKSIAELAKQTIRVIDGCKVDWSGKAGRGNIHVFWNELGRCRALLQNYYLKTHTLSASEQMDFFANCFVMLTATEA